MYRDLCVLLSIHASRYLGIHGTKVSVTRSAGELGVMQICSVIARKHGRVGLM